jgi:ribulose-5-phosphate 4-epimerase/fuculose-1-phosphate aldolase
MTEALAAELCEVARSLFDRGLTGGTSGNISLRCPDGGFLVTPTNSSLGRLHPDRLSRLDPRFQHVAGDPPTKEIPLHRAFYLSRGAAAQAVVHLHSPHAVALSTLTPADPDDVLLRLTPYPVMRLGPVPRLAYVRPGDPAVEAAIAALGGRCKAVLLANHGPVVSDLTLAAAAAAAEELEDAARLMFLVRGHPYETLSEAAVDDLRRHFPRG